MSGLSGDQKFTREELDLQNLAKAVTPEEFLDFISGKDIDDLRSRTESLGGVEFSYFLQEKPGSDYRYVYDPAQPGRVIDMHHLLATATLDERIPGFLRDDAGLGLEIRQLITGYSASAFREEDLRSNTLGERFSNGYLEPGGNLAAQFRDFFADRTLEGKSLGWEGGHAGRRATLEVGVSQRLLAKLGYFPEERINGVFTTATTAAVKEFQSDNNLPVTGRIDFETWKTLAEAGDIETLLSAEAEGLNNGQVAALSDEPSALRPAANDAEAAFVDRLMQSTTTGLEYARVAGKDSLSFSDPESGDRIHISADPSTRTISGVTEQGDPLFTVEIPRDAGEPRFAVENVATTTSALEHLETAIGKAEAVEVASQQQEGEPAA